MILDGIDKIFCINLQRRPDRRKEALDEFSKINLDFEFFDGVDGHELKLQGRIKPGHIGCVLSHLNLYKHIKSLEAGEIFLITEDDVVFSDDFKEVYSNQKRNIPDDWMLLYFGGNHNNLQLELVSDKIHRLKKTYTTHCYLVRKSSIDILINEFDTPRIFNEEVDVHLSNIQKKYPCYGFSPAIAWQRESFSDIEMRNVNYEFLKR